MILKLVGTKQRRESKNCIMVFNVVHVSLYIIKETNWNVIKFILSWKWHLVITSNLHCMGYMRLQLNENYHRDVYEYSNKSGVAYYHNPYYEFHWCERMSQGCSWSQFGDGAILILCLITSLPTNVPFFNDIVILQGELWCKW